MATQKNPSAFPDPKRALDMNISLGKFETGMTLRDYFAAKAMQSFILVFEQEYLDELDEDSLATNAYNLANAMLKTRETSNQ